MSIKIVIIGGVAAGPKTACRAKRLMPEADITIIDMDTLISYGGCGIPYYISGDVTDEKELRSTSFHVTRDVPFFENAKGVKVRTATRATAIDRQAKNPTWHGLGRAVECAADLDCQHTGQDPGLFACLDRAVLFPRARSLPARAHCADRAAAFL